MKKLKIRNSWAHNHVIVGPINNRVTFSSVSGNGSMVLL